MAILPTSEPSDAELLLAASSDPAAFRELYERYAEQIHGYLARGIRAFNAEAQRTHVAARGAFDQRLQQGGADSAPAPLGAHGDRHLGDILGHVAVAGLLCPKLTPPRDSDWIALGEDEPEVLRARPAVEVAGQLRRGEHRVGIQRGLPGSPGDCLAEHRRQEALVACVCGTNPAGWLRSCCHSNSARTPAPGGRSPPEGIPLGEHHCLGREGPEAVAQQRVARRRVRRRAGLDGAATLAG